VDFPDGLAHSAISILATALFENDGPSTCKL
jgi:hypothetical protein